MKKRDYYFDNAKFILIFLVVFGHFIQSFISKDPYILSLYKTIYTFHMPAFILISGFFAKGIQKPGYVVKLVKKLIFPYILFQIIYSVFYYYINDDSTFKVDPLSPHWSLWFLISLFCWNVLLYLFIKKWSLGPLPGMTLALAGGLIIGFFNDATSVLSIIRTFVFFPMFLLGYYLQKDHFKAIKRTKTRFFGILLFIITFGCMLFFPDQVDDNWLLGSKSYQEMDMSSFNAVLIRMGLYLLNTLMVLTFFALVPRKRYFFTSWGTNTLYVYLLHGFIIRTFRASSLVNSIDPTSSLIIILALTFGLTLLLSSPIVASITQPIIEMKANKTKYMLNKAKTKYRQFIHSTPTQ
jgi:fucose 4-O-acetylase-like acetyltransferase